MEPVSPASEISRDDEFFDALPSLLQQQHRRQASVPASLVATLHEQLPPSQQQQHLQQRPQYVQLVSHVTPPHRGHHNTTDRPAAESTDFNHSLPPTPTPESFRDASHPSITDQPAYPARSTLKSSADQPADTANRAVEVTQSFLYDAEPPASAILPSASPDALPSRRRSHHLHTALADIGAQHHRESSLNALTANSLRADHAANEISLAAFAGSGNIRRRSYGMDKDLFLEVAEDAPKRTAGRTSVQDKRRSLPPTDLRALTAMDNRRPRTSGGPGSARPGSRLDEIRSNFRHRNSELGRHTESQSGIHEGITLRPRRNSKFSMDRQPSSPLSPSRRTAGARSPDLSIYHRPGSLVTKQRRSSQLGTLRQGSEGESPAESSEPKQQSLPESVSAESQTAPSTVWDELDDLKSRIKKLELTGKLPSTSSAAITASGSPQLERPRTATTAPTTIDSSPKRDRTRRPSEDAQAVPQSPAAPSAADTHPLLHAALAKAKPLLNPALYRSLEASAADASHLASLAGVGMPASSAASVVNGGTSTDRALRRKADSMCRNLTELCLALCDGKHEPSSLPASPMLLNGAPSSGRLSRMSTARGDAPSGGRPMSRLEARRSSMLGVSADSPRAVNAEDASASEQESTPSNNGTFDRQRYVRPSSRLTVPRSRYEDTSGDEDPTIRPPSRVGSEFSFRSRRTLDTQTVPLPPPHRSFSLREAITKRRGSGAGADGHRDLVRMASLSSDTGRSRWTRESTPPVLEEEINEQEAEPARPPPRQSRLSSLAHMKLGPRRVFTDVAARASSRSGRQVAVE